MSSEDRRLVEAFLQDREESAFRELYRRHAPALHQTILRMAGATGRDAEEIFQITWIRAAERLDRFRWQSTLRSWLVGIAVNCSREHLRRQRRTDRFEVSDVPDLPPVARIYHEIDQIDLERAISGLPDGYREVLVLHDVQGYTHQEIGRILGIEAGTSKSQLSRARRAVRAELNQTEAVINEHRAL